MRKYALILVLLPLFALQAVAQVTTYFYGRDKIESKNVTAALYSVENNVNGQQVLVTIELIPKKNMSIMNFWTSRNTVIIIKGSILELPIAGFATKLDNGFIGVRTQPFSGDWGWKNVKKGEKYYYILLFEGAIPPGITNFTMIDRGNSLGEHGYQFWDYKINNPRIGSTSFTETTIKNNILSNNDGICGIYEGFEGEQYKLSCIYDNGTYKLLYLEGVGNKWWIIGDLKAILKPSATKGVFKAEWYMEMKNKRDDVLVVFDNGCMRVTIDGEVSNYIKMFPTSNQIKTSKEWTGTGFALKDKYVATNYHVVEDANNIQLYGVLGNFDVSYNAKVVATDIINDIAILEITDQRFKGFEVIPYNVKTTFTEVGEEIFVLGYPLTNTMGDEIKLTTGVVSLRTGFKGDVSLYQISAPIQPGNSGGPLFDSRGNLIGIVSAKHNNAENVGYAIKTSYLKNLIDSYYSTSILPSNTLVRSTSLTEHVKNFKGYVFMIKCNSK